MHKTYLGDSVYAELNEARQIVLTTENGEGPSNTICLEPEVVRALSDYTARIACILMPTKPTTEEIAAEIAALKVLKPNGLWPDRTREYIDTIIKVLEDGIDENSPEYEDMTAEQKDFVLITVGWRDGTVRYRPSEGWEGLVELAE